MTPGRSGNGRRDRLGRVNHPGTGHNKLNFFLGFVYQGGMINYFCKTQSIKIIIPFLLYNLIGRYRSLIAFLLYFVQLLVRL
jgi:hypothetical protein